MKLYRADKAPKDATMILGDFGWPWLCPAMWNQRDQKWVIATVQTCGDDCYFENDQEDDASLKCWTPFPKLPR